MYVWMCAAIVGTGFYPSSRKRGCMCWLVGCGLLQWCYVLLHIIVDVKRGGGVVVSG